MGHALDRGTEVVMGVSLSKGQSVSLVKQDGGGLRNVRMGLGWDAVRKKGLFGSSRAVDRPGRLRAAVRRRAATSSTRCGSSS